MNIAHVRTHTLKNPDVAAPGGPGATRESVALVVVEIETTDGLIGLGTVGGFPTGATEIIEQQFAPMLIGIEASDIETIWDRLYASLDRQGQQGTGVMALSGVDIALWDLLGKSLEQPVVSLIGGGPTARIPIYLSSLSLQRRPNAAALLNEISVARQSGFVGFKYFFSRDFKEGSTGRKQELDLLREIRDVIGDDARLMVDAHFNWDLPYAQRMLEPLAQLDVAWLENPLPIEDLAGYETLARTGLVALAAGESERTRFPFTRLIDAGVFYLQPDINRVGGFTEALRICGLAASHHRIVAPHQGWLHSWHLIAGRSCCEIGEYFPRRDPLPGNAVIWDVLDGEPEADNGLITIPQHAGFGWQLNHSRLTTRLAG